MSRCCRAATCTSRDGCRPLAMSMIAEVDDVNVLESGCLWNLKGLRAASSRTASDDIVMRVDDEISSHHHRPLGPRIGVQFWQAPANFPSIIHHPPATLLVSPDGHLYSGRQRALCTLCIIDSAHKSGQQTQSMRFWPRASVADGLK